MLILLAGCQQPANSVHQGSVDPATAADTSIAPKHDIKSTAAALVSYSFEPLCTVYAPLDGLFVLAAGADIIVGAGYYELPNLTVQGQLFTFDSDSHTISILGDRLDKGSYFSSLCVTNARTIWAVIATGYMNLNTQTYTVDFDLALYSADGICQFRTALPALSDEIDGFFYEDSCSILADSKGELYLYNGGIVLHFDAEGAYLGYFQSDQYCFGAVSTGNGTIFGVSFESGQAYLYPITSTGPTDDLVAVGANSNSSFYSGDADDVLYYVMDDTLWKLHTDTMESSKLVSLDEVGVPYGACISPVILEDTFIFITDSEMGDGIFQLAPLEVPETRTALSYATMDQNDPLLYAIAGFNRSSHQYYVQVWDYSESCKGDGSLFLQALGKEIRTGTGPDIVNFRGVDWRGYIHSSQLEDLTPYLAQSPTANQETLLPGVLEAMQTEGGTYTLPTAISLTSAFCTQTAYQNMTDLSLEGLRCYAEQKNAHLFAGVSGAEYIYACYGYGTSDVVGWDRALEYVPTEDDDLPGYLALRNGAAVFSTARFQSLADLFRTEAYLLQEPFVCIGFPGASSEGAYLVPETELAILSASQEKSGAWALLEYALSDECQKSRQRIGFPVRTETLTKLFEAALTATSTEYADYVTIDDVRYRAQPLTQDMLERYLSLVTSASVRYRDDPAVQAILTDEAAALLAGEKTPVETAALIESRIALYWSENGEQK